MSLQTKLYGRYQRFSARAFRRRPFAIVTPTPIISFTFDDFPISALSAGGAILRRFGAAGTYYTSLGLMGQQTPTGTMFREVDLKELVRQGHELGCHTFDHRDSWDTPPDVFERSLVENQRALGDLVPGAAFKTLSYPISPPRPDTKRRAARYYAGCRGGGQTFNAGTTDLNHLSAFFLEKSRDDLAAVQSVIDENRRAGGWLIFATHDVAADPTVYGCTPAFFEDVVRISAASGARILPVGEALGALSRPT